MVNNKCLCGRKLSKNVVIALSRSWHERCFNLYKIAYKDGFNKKHGECK